MKEESLFEQASQVPPDERAAFLDRECPDPVLRARVEALLAADAASRNAPPPFPDDQTVAHTPQPDPDPAATGSYRPAPPTEAEGTIIAGRYKLRQQIGEGGMGTVWMATQTEPVKRQVAVKLIRVERGQSKTILARFEAERQAIALMDHPHIAKLLDAGTTETGAPFFVMELVKGIPLNDFCDQHRLTIPERLNLFMKICSAVQHAHQKGIIHRDLKPSNILVESHDGKPVPKVIDFGLAKATTGLQLTEQSLHTGFGTVLGTPLYMAPEQANLMSLDVDTRADIYALGVILYELLTGTTPITRETLRKAALDEMLRLIREQEAPTPSSRLSSSDHAPSVAANRQLEPAKLSRLIRGELDWIVMKALSKERDRRYETANGFARDIERFLNHEPVSAGPPTAAYRIQKFLRRHRGSVLAASLVVLALVGGIIGTTIGLLEARRQADIARQEAEEKERQRGLAEERLIQVETEKQRTEEQKRIAEAVNDFLQNKLLAQADTVTQANQMLRVGGLAGEAKYNPTIRELLDRAAKELAPDKIERNFPNQPLVQAEILRTVGQTYRGIGEAGVAIDFLTRSVELFRRHVGPDHPDTLISMNNLADGYTDVGKLELALPLYEETLKLMKAKLGADHPNTLVSRNNLAECYRATGKLDLALPLFEETLKLMKAKLGADHPDRLTSMNNLAESYRAAGKLEHALPLFEETLKLRRAKLGDDHPDTLQSRNNLAAGYWDSGKLDLALPLFEETLKLMKAKLGDDHPDTLTSMGNLAGCYWAAGKLDLALPLFEETLKLKKAKLRDDHPDTLQSMNNLAEGYRAAGKLEQALSLHEETLKLRRAKLGDDHPHTLQSMGNLALGYHSARKFDLALPLYEETLKLKKAKLGPDHPATLTSMGNLGKAYCDAMQGEKAAPVLRDFITGQRKRLPKEDPRFAELLAQMSLDLLKCDQFAAAEEMLRECLAIREKKEPEVWSTFNVMSMLGGALLGQKKYADAEPLLLKGYEGMKAREKTIPPQANTRIPESLDRLIELYKATNKPDEVKTWQAERAKYPATKEVAPMPKEGKK
jgi:serine/threonine protein kinase/tetratricopeptide (TPR) repeat protein